MIYKNIRKLREESNLTQHQISSILNVAQSIYSDYENGTTVMPPNVLIKLADYYGTSVDYLLDRTDVISPHPRVIK